MGKNLRTDYFDEAIIRDAVTGCCHDFALAVHRMTGWPLACVWRQPVRDRFTIMHDPSPLHVFCVEPGGNAVDAEGLTDLETLKEAFSNGSDIGRLTIIIQGTESDWETVTRTNGLATALAPRNRGIEAAERVIASSGSFLRLLLELGWKSPGADREFIARMGT